MSGTSGDCPCPKCGGMMSTYMDWKPHDWVDGMCLNCGYHYYTKEGIMNDEDLESERVELDWINSDCPESGRDSTGRLWRSYYEPDNNG